MIPTELPPNVANEASTLNESATDVGSQKASTKMERKALWSDLSTGVVSSLKWAIKLISSFKLELYQVEEKHYNT